MKWQGPTGPVYRGKRREAGGVEEYEREKTESQEPRASKRASLWEETPPLRLEGKGRSSSEKYRMVHKHGTCKAG